MCIFRYSVVF